MPNRIAFLDRDGVLNQDLGYVFRPEQFIWMPEAREAIKWLRENSFIVAVATNQSGIGRGMYTEAEFSKLTDHIQSELAEIGTQIDSIYYCPHLPEENCFCRKPKPGMLLQGLAEHNALPEDCFMIGDKSTDIEAAQAAGIPGHLYTGGSLLAMVRRSSLMDR